MKKHIQIFERLACVMVLTIAAVGCKTADFTKAIADTCPVHGGVMRTQEVPIVYGLPQSKELAELKEGGESFPYGRDYRLGGCEVRREEKALIYICPECEKARESWLGQKGYRDINSGLVR